MRPLFAHNLLFESKLSITIDRMACENYLDSFSFIFQVDLATNLCMTMKFAHRLSDQNLTAKGKYLQ